MGGWRWQGEWEIEGGGGDREKGRGGARERVDRGKGRLVSYIAGKKWNKYQQNITHQCWGVAWNLPIHQEL